MDVSQLSPALLQLICELEIRLHQPAIRHDRTQLDQLLHTEFAEFGVSGQAYSRQQTLNTVLQPVDNATIWSQDFALQMPAYSVGLLTYKSARIDEAGGVSHYALRSSLWQYAPAGWQLRFHQATPTEAFALEKTVDASVLEAAMS